MVNEARTGFGFSLVADGSIVGIKQFQLKKLSLRVVGWLTLCVMFACMYWLPPYGGWRLACQAIGIICALVSFSALTIAWSTPDVRGTDGLEVPHAP